MLVARPLRADPLRAQVPAPPPRAATMTPSPPRARAFTPSRPLYVPAAPPRTTTASRRPRVRKLDVPIPDARYYSSATGLRRVLRRLAAANALRGGAPLPPPQPRHVVVDIDACSTPLLRVHKPRSRALAALHPAMLAFAVAFLALCGIHWWPY